MGIGFFDTLLDSGVPDAMITYSTNWMGPVTNKWYLDRGLKSDSYCCGRVDVYGLPLDLYYDGKTEYSLPLMTKESWLKFTEWLHSFQTYRLYSLQELFEEFPGEVEFYNEDI